MLRIVRVCSQLCFISCRRTFPIPSTSSRRTDSFSIISNIRVPNFSHRRFAYTGPIPLIRPEARNFSIPSRDSGGTRRTDFFAVAAKDLGVVRPRPHRAGGRLQVQLPRRPRSDPPDGPAAGSQRAPALFAVVLAQHGPGDPGRFCGLGADRAHRQTHRHSFLDEP